MNDCNLWEKWRDISSAVGGTGQLAPKDDVSTTPLMSYEGIELDAYTELRFEIEERDTTVTLVLLSGLAEIFGTELVSLKPYEFQTGAKIGVFTYHGCVLQLRGKASWYVSKETPMTMYVNCSHALNEKRKEAELQGARGPITMVVGPNNVGKSTFCRMLLNYAVRLRQRPVFADIDVGLGDITIPGAMASIFVEQMASPAHGFSKKAPLVLHFGQTEPGSNSVLYKQVVENLAKKSLEKLRVNKRAKRAGIVINTCGWIKDEGYTLLLHAAQAFEVTVIFVIDQEGLYHDLKRDMPPFVTVVALPKSGGVVERSISMRIDEATQSLKEYFYGGRTRLFPYSFKVEFEKFKVYKIGAPPMPGSCMPSGMKAEDYHTKLVAVTPGPQLLHHILAISFAKSIKEDVKGSNVVGFIGVTNVDMELKSVTVLSPQPRPLPAGILLLSEQLFFDNQV